MKTNPSFSLRSTIVVVCLLLGHGASLAADQSKADELVQQGLSLRREGKATEALALFQRAHALAPAPRTFGQMGLAEASLERWVDADMHLSVSLTTPDDPWIRKNRAFLEQALATSKQHVGDLLVSGPPGVEIFADGKSIGILPAIPALHVAVGEAHVSATAPGFKPFDQSVNIRANERTTVTVTLSPIPLTPAPVAPASGTVVAGPTQEASPTLESTGSSSRKWVGASLASVGTGVLAWGIVWLAIDGKDDCGNVHGAACGTTYNTKTLGLALTGAGAAAIVTGGIVFFTGHRPHDSTVAVGITPNSILLQTRF